MLGTDTEYTFGVAVEYLLKIEMTLIGVGIVQK